MDTFLVRTLLVPVDVVLLGKWNWWPSRLHLDEPDEQASPGLVRRRQSSTTVHAG